MIRRAFVRALSGAILTTLLGVKAWRLEDAAPDMDGVRWQLLDPDGNVYAEGDDWPHGTTFELTPGTQFTYRVTIPIA